MVGAPTALAALSTLSGKAYVIYGGKHTTDLQLSAFSLADGIIISSGTTGDFCGSSVSAAGDINKDGFPDLIVGCPYATDYAGASYVVYGGPTISRTNVDLSTISAAQGFMIAGAYNLDYSGYSVSGAADDAGNSMVMVGAPHSNANLGSAYIIMKTTTFPSNATFTPTAGPTSHPSSQPSSTPTSRPTKHPTPVPTLSPTKAPTPPPFWVTNGPIIGGVVGPALLGFIPVYFSKQICFRVLDNWGRMTDVEVIRYQKRSRFRAFVYTSCKRAYLEDYITMKETREAKKEIDERASEAIRSSMDIEMLGGVNALHSGRIEDSDGKPAPSALELSSHSAGPVSAVSKNPMLASQGGGDADSDSEEMTVLALYSVRYDDELLNALHHAKVIMPATPAGAEVLLEDSAGKSTDLQVAVFSPDQQQHTFGAGKENFPVAHSELADALLALRQLVEHAPLLQYWATSLVSPLLHKAFNASLPARLSSKVTIALHFVLGHGAALLLPAQANSQSLLLSTASSTLYAARVLSVDYLNAHTQAANNQSCISQSSLQQCAAHMVVHLSPALLFGAAKALVLPGASLANSFDTVSSGVSLALGGAACLRIHSAAASQVKDSWITSSVPYVVDILALAYFSRDMQLGVKSSAHVHRSLSQLLTLAGRVMTADYLAKTAATLLRRHAHQAVDLFRNIVQSLPLWWSPTPAEAADMF